MELCAPACSAKSSSMSWDTLRTNKLRSALTVLGIVIGITSIVGMTSLLRGFDESFEAAFKEIGPKTITIAEVRPRQHLVRQELP